MLTTSDLAERMRCSPRTVARWARRIGVGRIIGRRQRVFAGPTAARTTMNHESAVICVPIGGVNVCLRAWLCEGEVTSFDWCGWEERAKHPIPSEGIRQGLQRFVAFCYLTLPSFRGEIHLQVAEVLGQEFSGTTPRASRAALQKACQDYERQQLERAAHDDKPIPPPGNDDAKPKAGSCDRGCDRGCPGVGGV